MSTTIINGRKFYIVDSIVYAKYADALEAVQGKQS